MGHTHAEYKEFHKITMMAVLSLNSCLLGKSIPLEPEEYEQLSKAKAVLLSRRHLFAQQLKWEHPPTGKFWMCCAGVELMRDEECGICGDTFYK